MNDNDDDNHALDYIEYGPTTCPHCRGRGWLREGCVQYECPDCDGVGEAARKDAGED